MDHIKHIELATKPGASITYRFQPSRGSLAKPTLVAFLNGMRLPQAGWTPAIEKFAALRTAKDQTVPALLTYDRYGQGQTTDRDPGDANAEDPMHGHTCLDVVWDLRQLLTQIASTEMNTDISQVTLIFVCNSIGGAHSRLYAQEYPGTVSGILFLDSVLANSTFVEVLPDPDAPDFDPAELPADTTIDALREARGFLDKVFHPKNGSAEGLSRKNLPSLLPYSDQPKLQSPDGQGPWISVLGHDFDTFAKESAKTGRQPEGLTQKYTNPYWHRYNEGLARLTKAEGRSKGPVQAPGTGHLIQQDNPDFVAEWMVEIVGNVLGE